MPYCNGFLSKVRNKITYYMERLANRHRHNHSMIAHYRRRSYLLYNWNNIADSFHNDVFKRFSTILERRGNIKKLVFITIWNKTSLNSVRSRVAKSYRTIDLANGISRLQSNSELIVYFMPQYFSNSSEIWVEEISMHSTPTIQLNEIIAGLANLQQIINMTKKHGFVEDATEVDSRYYKITFRRRDF
ncbi:uncharacterized protein LOC119689100 [Teleopsis dalmanni]|uniref:uncharacterized protein LOC119689100 n=1 Tax=Teleopsis dalmanni TaxID=139649 RepID=UPI0018CE2BC7|nr:uncharacterized protein LOC119689100 [Teleopsis dalmanni]